MRLVGKTLSVHLGARRVLDGITVSCEPGRITGLIGPNGAGKSTLLRALAGLLPLEGGEVMAGETMVSRAGSRSRAGGLGRCLAFLPQEREVHWPLAVRAIVALGRLPHGSGTGPGDVAAVERAMQQMDVAGLAERPADTLSGGELARVLVARALAQEAPIILADEPTAGLDPGHALALFEVLARLAAEGRTVAVALHDLTLAARFCHDVVLLQGGRIARSGPAKDVLEPEHLDPVFGVAMARGRIEGLDVIVAKSPAA